MIVLTVIGAATVLVLAANSLAMATTGKAILAGKINFSGKQTSIVRTTAGPGLQVKTKSTANSPLVVNGRGKVANFNADMLDGLDSSVLGARTVTYTDNGLQARSDITTWNLPLTAGATYQLNYDVGAIVTGTATPAAPLGLTCGFSKKDFTLTRGISTSTGFTAGQFYFVSGAATITPTASDQWMVVCQTMSVGATPTFSMLPDGQGGLHIDVTRIAGQTNKAIAEAP